MKYSIYTVGHSNHQTDKFVSLLENHGITAICDVRSKPYSARNPQFNRESIKRSLRDRGISYVFLGRELGARSEDDSCYVNGKVDFDLLSRTNAFQHGIQRINNGVEKFRIALMCAEKDPIECHRAILIARHFDYSRFSILHIHADNTIETQEKAVSRLIRKLGLESQDLFRSSESITDDAYRIQGSLIAYSRPLRTIEAEGEVFE